MNEVIQRLAKRTLDVQDACNLGALIRHLPKVLDELTAELRRLNEPTDSEAIRSHPIIMWWVNKIQSLARDVSIDLDAYTKLNDWAEGKNLPGSVQLAVVVSSDVDSVTEMADG